MAKNIVLKNFIINAFGIFFSRVLGLLRDIIIALFLGASFYSDIFFVALKMPAFFRRIFAEGAFVQSFLPNLMSARKKGAFCLNVLLNFSLIVFLFCVLVSFFANFFTKIFALGFDEKTITLASPLVAINFWYLFFIFLVTFFSAILNYKHKFFISSFSASLFNLSIVIAAFFVNKNDELNTIYYFSYATVLSGLAQLILHILAIKNSKIAKAMCLSIKFRKTKTKLNNFYSNFYHGLLGSSASQLSSLLDTTIASFLISGSISYLYYANRVFQLPLALFAIALSQVSFPKILNFLKNNDEKNALNFMKKANGVLLFLLTLSSGVGIIFSNDIMILLFQRGNFTQDDALISSYVLIAYLFGLIPFGLQKLLSLWLYAKFKQKIAAKIAFKSLFLTLIFSLIFVYFINDEKLKVLSIAFASSISALYLLLANIKEFGFERFFSLFTFKYLFLSLLFLSLLFLVLFVYKIYIVEFFINIFLFFKGLF